MKLKRESVKVNEGICFRCGKVIKLSRPEPAGDYANVRATWECECGMRNVYPQMIQPKEEMKMELMDSVRLMESKDYKDRFKAEYWQTKIRYERLKKLTTRMEAERIKNEQVKLMREETMDGSPEGLLREQQACMGRYLHVLELRAEIEKIEL